MQRGSRWTGYAQALITHLRYKVVGVVANTEEGVVTFAIQDLATDKALSFDMCNVKEEVIMEDGEEE